MNWNDYEIGGGWHLGDFLYDGNTLVGFSKNGAEKRCGNRHLVLPSVVPNNNRDTLEELDKITKIDDGAFDEKILETLVIPDGIEEIGDVAFCDCRLKKVILPESLKTIGEIAFKRNCLKSIYIPKGITIIKNGAFEDNELEDISLPETLIEVEQFAFCDNLLRSLTLPSGLKKIGRSAFENNFLSELHLPDGLETIGPWAFESNKLTKVNIPMSLTEICEGAFKGNIGCDSRHNVALLTPDRSNPNNLKDESTISPVLFLHTDEDSDDVIRCENCISGHAINPQAVINTGSSKAYVLTSDVYEEFHGTDIRMFGVFDSEELAEKRAKELGFVVYLITEVEINDPVEEYIGSYIE